MHVLVLLHYSGCYLMYQGDETNEYFYIWRPHKQGTLFSTHGPFSSNIQASLSKSATTFRISSSNALTRTITQIKNKQTVKSKVGKKKAESESLRVRVSTFI